MSATPSETEAADRFVRSVEDLARLLRGISIDAVAVAMKEERCEKEMCLYDERRKAWGVLLREVANDTEAHMERLVMARKDSEACLRHINGAVAVFNGGQFKEAGDNLERFINLCERFNALKNGGFLDKIIELSGRA